MSTKKTTPENRLEDHVAVDANHARTGGQESIPCPHCGTLLEPIRAQSVGGVELTEQRCPNQDCSMFWGVGDPAGTATDHFLSSMRALQEAHPFPWMTDPYCGGEAILDANDRLVADFAIFTADALKGQSGLAAITAALIVEAMNERHAGMLSSDGGPV